MVKLRQQTEGRALFQKHFFKDPAEASPELTPNFHRWS